MTCSTCLVCFRASNGGRMILYLKNCRPIVSIANVKQCVVYATNAFGFQQISNNS